MSETIQYFPITPLSVIKQVGLSNWLTYHTKIQI
jgi:hypothetical protein